MPEPQSRPTARPYRPTALPPVTARVLAFVAIVVGGVCSGLIVYSIASLQCGPDDGRAATILPEASPSDGPAPAAGERDGGDESGCPVLAALGGLVGAVAGALGVAVMAVLALRAMGEWRKDLEPDGG